MRDRSGLHGIGAAAGARLVLTMLSAVLGAGVANANVRMVELDETTQQVVLRNFSGATTIDVSGYYLCREPGTYQPLSILTIAGVGDLSLSPGEQVELVYTPIPSAGGIGLYFSAAGFGSAVNMADYVQYKGVSGFRQSVADTAGIWSPGTFAIGDPGPYTYVGDGVDNGAAFWTNSPPEIVPATPALSAAGVAILAVAITALAIVIPRVRPVVARVRD